MSVRKPYSLKSASGNSDAYFSTIAAFADRWLAAAQVDLARPVSHFLAYRAAYLAHAVQSQGRIFSGTERQDAPRSFNEAAFEMLVLGVLLREHGAQALHLPPAPAWMLAKLVETQDRLPLPSLERSVKLMRGLIQGLAKGEQGREPGAIQNGVTSAVVETYSLEEGAAGVVNRLVVWLRAEGSLTQAERMAEWRDYLAHLDAQSAEAVLARCLLLAETFEEASLLTLGVYTAQVGEFIACTQTEARWRYDSALVTRSRVEYHLGMLGTEILTRTYRPRFMQAQRKMVVVPDCLCARSRRTFSSDGAICQALLTPLGSQCSHCTPNCKVQTLTRLGQRYGFEVYILPDEQRSLGLNACRKLKNAGVVGVSCALTNWEAGWQLNDTGIPAQGVLLDYASCKNHWQEQGMPTDVNIRKVIEIIGLHQG